MSDVTNEPPPTRVVGWGLLPFFGERRREERALARVRARRVALAELRLEPRASSGSGEAAPRHRRQQAEAELDAQETEAALDAVAVAIEAVRATQSARSSSVAPEIRDWARREGQEVMARSDDPVARR
ncbi:hypothetical protein [Cellulosimicrobium sp. KWT-B]|uniref:hypothetical protein n=1 Tax=Cellulosimicrobium sp. KWT-B TaxID=1981152 RepID=UPI001177C8D3|nr:hypothetical protein [Cellulosimicrobium sp. KWT-B]